MNKKDQEVVEFLSMMNSDFIIKHSKEVRTTGYYETFPETTIKYFRRFMELGIIKPGMKFIDLGAGLGLPTISAAHIGLVAGGIEYNPTLARGAQELIALTRKVGLLPPETICKVVEGSYFPIEYSAIRFNNGSIAQQHEKEVSEWIVDNEIRLIPESSNHDVYADLGIKLEEADVVFAYTWDVQTPSVLEIFAEYTKQNAILIHKSAFETPVTREAISDLKLKRNITPIKGENSPFYIVTKKERRKSLMSKLYTSFKIA